MTYHNSIHVPPAAPPAGGTLPLPKPVAAWGESPIGKEKALQITEQLTAIGTSFRVREGETLYVEGEAADKCYEVVSGLVKEYNTLQDGSCHISGFRFRGDLIGLPSSTIYPHTVEAVQDSYLVSYPVNRFRKLVAEAPALSQWFAQQLLDDLERARAHGVALSRLSAMERVAGFLLSLSRETERSASPSGVFAIPMSRQDIADHVGLTIETVCRCLTTLKRKGLVSMVSAHGFTLPDRSALAAFAGRDERTAG